MDLQNTTTTLSLRDHCYTLEDMKAGINEGLVIVVLQTDGTPLFNGACSRGARSSHFDTGLTYAHSSFKAHQECEL